MTAEAKLNLQRIWIPLGQSAAIVLAIIGGIIAHERSMAAMDSRLVKIESNRFTVDDGKQIWQEIAEIRRQMADGQPSRWLAEKLDNIDKRLGSIEQKIK